MPVIDDADDPCIDRCFNRVKRKACFLAADEEHLFANPCTDRVDRNQRTSGRLAFGSERLDEEQLQPGEVFVFASGDHVADDFRELHNSSKLPGSGFVQLDGVDDADDRRVDGTVFHA